MLSARLVSSAATEEGWFAFDPKQDTFAADSAIAYAHLTSLSPENTAGLPFRTETSSTLKPGTRSGSGR
jgi:hypothetical protein